MRLVIDNLCRVALGGLALLVMMSGQTQVRAASASSAFAFTWAGKPATPQPWVPRPVNDWYVAKHDRDLSGTFGQPNSMVAQHGSDCGPFQGYGVGGFHTVTSFADSTFICNNHMMTAIDGPGYAEIAFTPAQMVDFGQGTASITWHQSTLRTSCRDWLSFDLMAFTDYLNLTDGIGVDLNGEARNEIHITTGASCPTAYTAADIRNFTTTAIGGPGGAVENAIPNSAQAGVSRAKFELDISRTHVRFGMPDFNLWMVDGNLSSPLPYSQAVIHFAQHSYTPDKECNPTPIFCQPDTWHWSDFAISNAAPFTILNADAFQVSHTEWGFPTTVNFAAPSPANSYLVMDAIAQPGTLQVSPDGGSSWMCVCKTQVAEKNPSGTFTDNQQNQIFMPIPAGIKSLLFKGVDVYWTPWMARDIAIFASTQTAVPPGNNPPPAAGNGGTTAANGSGGGEQGAGQPATGNSGTGGQARGTGGAAGTPSGSHEPATNAAAPWAASRLTALASQPVVLFPIAAALLALAIVGITTARRRTRRLDRQGPTGRKPGS